jgi:hypothetical protein
VAGVTISVRVTGAGGGGDSRRCRTVGPVIAATSVTAMANTAVRSRIGSREAGAGSAGLSTDADAVSASSTSSLASAASASRRLRSFSRQRRSKRRIVAGVSAGSNVQSGSVLSTDASTCDTVSPVNTAVP